MFVWFGVAIAARLANHLTAGYSIFVIALVTAITTVVMSMTTLGMFRNAVGAVGGTRPSPRALFLLNGLVWYLLVSFVSTLVVIVGLAALIVPGIIIGGFWLLFPYAIVDKHSPWLRSLQESWRLVRGNWWYVVSTWLATYVVMAISGLLTFGLAFFITVPWTLLVHARIYRGLATSSV